ncbi:hypothetical protein FGSG_12466 [Fusarium graminearum PH-1]|uniref:Chromosome 2, complete genome n=1 Tax=Gibberella zeae (strain ATCC MYA-4620 / CBS 123657 / FGSC 9075 / NRRL 31084 / PH-1) TaxID=229533 RepID=I1S6J4_GIBZE|nr:hypothetical protein FGSG_12466 [Fusarium graminearum PH-1]ESU09939.1 hypothetical protein FGSG_12466 [Fusarium graminearum PH-1]CEF78080.1 unnamed protein product [Fusarium graminearum]|eukprot:XP_011322438.1 hypothetical protein FGSG_12466 [Fusarium graminearum PH-1]
MTSLITFGYPSDTVVLAYRHRELCSNKDIKRDPLNIRIPCTDIPKTQQSRQCLDDMRCTPYVNVLDTHECHPSVTIFNTILLRKNNIYSAHALCYNLSKAPSELQ